jgi:hypothetical protein
MEREELLEKVAPCGLLCYTCAAAKNGAIRYHSGKLMDLLESFEPYAERFAKDIPDFSKYPDFKRVLRLFAAGDCEGCRSGKCKYPGCPVWPCINQKEHDYCFQCRDFPCKEVDNEPVLKKKWLQANSEMKEIGVEAYFEKARDISHYE